MPRAHTVLRLWPQACLLTKLTGKLNLNLPVSPLSGSGTLLPSASPSPGIEGLMVNLNFTLRGYRPLAVPGQVVHWRPSSSV